MNPSNLTVEEFTTPSPTSVSKNEKLTTIWNIMHSQRIRHVLVKEDDEIVGILSERDLTTFSQSQDFNKIEAQDVMTKNLVIVTPDTKLYEVALKMSKEKIGSTIVQDPSSNYIGIFTATDALNALVEVLRGEI